MFNKTNKPAPAKPQPTVAPVAPSVEAPNLNLTKKPSSPVAGMGSMGGAKPFSSVGSGLLIDGNVNAADLTIWKTQFGTSPGAAVAVASVPEPAAGALAVGALAAVALRRRRASR